MTVLNQTVDIAIAFCYKNENTKTPKITSTQLLQVVFPKKDQITGLWNLLVRVTERAQQNGAFDTIEESGILYDSIIIMGNLLGSLTVYVDYRDQIKLQEQQSLGLDTIQENEKDESDSDDENNKDCITK